MGFFSSPEKKGKSVRARINAIKKKLQKKKEREELAKLQKQLRGY